jgi:hypothetical protein
VNFSGSVVRGAAVALALATISAGCAAAQSSSSATAGAIPTGPSATPAPIGTAVIPLPTTLPESPTYEQLAPLFNYDSSRSFDMKVVGTEKADGVETLDITFAGADGQTVSAWLVMPMGDGPFPAVLFEHGLQEDRGTFSEEAKVLARDHHIAGLVVTRVPSALVGYQLIEAIYQAREMRRALDLLASTPKIDPNRLGYVGFSQGGVYGVMVGAVETRFKTAVYMSAPPESIILPSGTLAVFAPHLKPATVFFQYGTGDGYCPKTDVDAFSPLVTIDTTVTWYEAGHELDMNALSARAAWLAAKL